MNILILGDRARYEKYMPESAKKLPVNITFLPVNADADVIAREAGNARIILADAIASIDDSLMDKLPELKLIHSDGVGFNGIDIESARRRGIYVSNCKGCNADGVAEAAVMLMLMITRQAVPGRRAVLEGRQMEYKEHIMRSDVPEFADHSIGIVGLGDIGTATARRLKGFGNKVYYYSPHRKSENLEKELSVEYLPLEKLLPACDILSLHCAVTEETEGMVNDEFIGRMKPGAYLVNTSRGQLVDNMAVRRALISGRLSGAGFDTLWPEPTPADHPLVDLPEEVRESVAYLPHLGGNAGPAFRRAHEVLWENVRRITAGERPVNVVNGL